MDPRRKGIRAVVDTNVVAYHLLGTPPFAEEAGRFLRAAGDLCAPALWEAELANVLWMAVRKGILETDEAISRLGLAAQLGISSVPSRILWQGALMCAVHSGVPIYDTLFVELAHREEIPLATFDARLCKTFPDIAKRPRDLVSG
ncbi:MAG: type II toxin-antitoxin system VapC family toxin [Acidobacteriia bacterium]|nr:type II toxin-antitoxin system VapC family toxin [Terriglobia bacterium]